MATSYVPSSGGFVPPDALLFTPAQPSGSPDFAAALLAAAAAERSLRDPRRNTRCRLSFLLCELVGRLRQTSGFDPSRSLPLSRTAMADLLGVPLCKVKRVLALLSLSDIVESDGRSIRVLDWRRLCEAARLDPQRVGFAADGDAEEPVNVSVEEDEPAKLVTATGEPACFV